jgi:hypothetical protein
MSTFYCRLPYSSIKPGDLLIVETDTAICMELCLSNDLVKKYIKLFNLERGYSFRLSHEYNFIRHYLQNIEILYVDGTIKTLSPEDLEDY